MKNNYDRESGVITSETAIGAATSAFQRNIQIMRIALGLTVLSLITFSITLTSSYWILITYPPGFFARRQNLYIVRATYGVIWKCVIGRAAPNVMFGKHS